MAKFSWSKSFLILVIRKPSFVTLLSAKVRYSRNSVIWAFRLWKWRISSCEKKAGWICEDCHSGEIECLQPIRARTYRWKYLQWHIIMVLIWVLWIPVLYPLVHICSNWAPFSSRLVYLVTHICIPELFSTPCLTFTHTLTLSCIIQGSHYWRPAPKSSVIQLGP